MGSAGKTNSWRDVGIAANGDLDPAGHMGKTERPAERASRGCMRPDRSSSGQRAKHSREPPLAGPPPASTQAVNGPATGKAVCFGPFRFLSAQRMLLEGDKPLPLGSRALDILNLLLERPGEVIRKDEIIARV